MKYTKLGKTDLTVSRVSYGGIVSAGFYGNVTTPPRGRMPPIAMSLGRSIMA